MLRKVINPILFLPLAIFIHHTNPLSGETSNYVDKTFEEKSKKTLLNYQDIEKIILNNQELKSLENLVTSASYNLSSEVAQRYHL